MGTYEPGNPSCDGDCALPDLCRRFRDWCVIGDHNPGKIIPGKSAEDIERLVSGSEEPETVPLPPRARSVGRRGRMDIPDECLELVAHFEELLRDRYGADRLSPASRVVFRPGLLFKVDHIKDRRRVVWYCKSLSQDKVVAGVYLRPATGTVDIRLPHKISQLRERLSAKAYGKLAPSSLRSGQYWCVCRRLAREGVGLVVGAIKMLDMKGDYPLPKVED